MKQVSGNRTFDAFPLPPRRGRKPTGAAMSPAERQAKYRAKLKAQPAQQDQSFLAAENARLERELGQLAASYDVLKAQYDDQMFKSMQLVRNLRLFMDSDKLKDAEIDRLNAELSAINRNVTKKGRA